MGELAVDVLVELTVDAFVLAYWLTVAVSCLAPVLYLFRETMRDNTPETPPISGQKPGHRPAENQKS